MSQKEASSSFVMLVKEGQVEHIAVFHAVHFAFWHLACVKQCTHRTSTLLFKYCRNIEILPKKSKLFQASCISQAEVLHHHTQTFSLN